MRRSSVRIPCAAVRATLNLIHLYPTYTTYEHRSVTNFHREYIGQEHDETQDIASQCTFHHPYTGCTVCHRMSYSSASALKARVDHSLTLSNVATQAPLLGSNPDNVEVRNTTSVHDDVNNLSCPSSGDLNVWVSIRIRSCALPVISVDHRIFQELLRFPHIPRLQP